MHFFTLESLLQLPGNMPGARFCDFYVNKFAHKLFFTLKMRNFVVSCASGKDNLSILFLKRFNKDFERFSDEFLVGFQACFAVFSFKIASRFIFVSSSINLSTHRAAFVFSRGEYAAVFE